MVKIPKNILRDIERKSQKTRKKDYNNFFEKKFDKLKEEMIKEFLSDPVTSEILAGPSGTNISGTLGGISNLFAFIGFNAGDEPIEPILRILEGIKYREGESQKNSGKKYIVELPTADDIFAVTPMPWATGRSWAKGIETGISGIGYLLNKSTSSSRSGVAIQTKKPVRSGRFSNRSYISAFIKKYNKKFKELS